MYGDLLGIHAGCNPARVRFAGEKIKKTEEVSKGVGVEKKITDNAPIENVGSRVATI